MSTVCFLLVVGCSYCIYSITFVGNYHFRYICRDSKLSLFVSSYWLLLVISMTLGLSNSDLVGTTSLPISNCLVALRQLDFRKPSIFLRVTNISPMLCGCLDMGFKPNLSGI